MRFCNVAFKITVDDDHIKFNEISVKLPVFTEGDKGNVTNPRIIKTEIWNTIVLPFALTKAKAEAIFGSYVELASFSGFETEYYEKDPDAKEREDEEDLMNMLIEQERIEKKQSLVVFVYIYIQNIKKTSK